MRIIILILGGLKDIIKMSFNIFYGFIKLLICSLKNIGVIMTLILLALLR